MKRKILYTVLSLGFFIGQTSIWAKESNAGSQVKSPKKTTKQANPTPVPETVEAVIPEPETPPVSTETVVSQGSQAVVEEEFSLDELDKEPAGGHEEAPAGGGHGGGRPGGGAQHLEAIVVVDATLDAYLGDKKELTFGSNHEYIMLGFEPRPHIRFIIEVVEQVYWELQYSFNANNRVKVGKLAIPFGPIFLHQIMAGLVEKPLVGGGARQFMVPLTWAEYGLGYYRRMIDHEAVELTVEFWLTNGLQGEVKVADGTVDFTKEPGDRDNNLDKAFGFRLNSRWFGKYGLNTSFYTSKWADDKLSESGKLLENFWEGDRMYLGNVDLELPYNMIPLPFFRNFQAKYEYALMRTRSTLRDASGKDFRVPWHNKSTEMIELTYNGLHKWFDLRFRYGTYDDNWDVLNNRDLLNFNVAAIFEISPGIQFIPMYMWNRERVNEIKDDAILVKCFIQL